MKIEVVVFFVTIAIVWFYDKVLHILDSSCWRSDHMLLETMDTTYVGT
jgi:hypothetical protein